MSRFANSNRRNVLKSIGGLAVGGALAGCTGGNNGSNSGGDGGSSSSGGSSSGGSSSGGSSGGNSTPTSTPKPSYNAKMGIVSTEMNQVPSLAALRQMLPKDTDNRMQGSFRTFDSSSLPMQALVGGSIDYYALSFGNVVQAALAGTELVVIGTKNKGTDYAWVINTKKCPDVKSVKDLVDKGHTIGIAGLGGLSHTQVAGVLGKEGLPTDPDKANIVSVGGSSARTSAVASGKVDSTVIHIDQYRQLKEQGAPVDTLFQLKKYFPNFVGQTFTVRKSFLENAKTKAHAQAYIQVAVEADKLATENFDWLFKKVQEIQAKPLSKDSAKTAWKLNADTLKTWPYTKDAYTKESYKNYVDAQKAANILTDKQASQIDYDKLLNFDLWNSAVDNMDAQRWLD
ncbi:MAG: ABC transporter substrate-binding protein [Salinigranum sp.]